MYRFSAPLHRCPSIVFPSPERGPTTSFIHAHSISAELASKMASSRAAVGRMAARFFNDSHSKAYSSLSKAIATRGTNLTSTSPLVSGASIPPCCPTSSLLLVPRRYGHTVRIILKEDLPDGRGYSGDVMTVKAGYARNYLVPKKMALYATPENFARLGVADPEAETMEEKRARLAAEAAVEEDEEAAADLRAADLLKHYLRNKVVSTMSVHAVADGACVGLATVVSLWLIVNRNSLTCIFISQRSLCCQISSHLYHGSSRSNATSIHRRAPSIPVWSTRRTCGISYPSS